MTQAASYFLARQPTELERLQLQSRVWEPAGRALLAQLPSETGRRALDAGCGVLGWLRVLSEWVGAQGSVVGSAIDDRMLAGARSFVETEALGNVTLLKDDLFASQLQAGSFDLVHSRFQIAPFGRAREQISVYRRLVKPGGWIVLEDSDMASWRVNPDAPAVQRLIDLIKEGFEPRGVTSMRVVNFHPSLGASGSNHAWAHTSLPSRLAIHTCDCRCSSRHLSGHGSKPLLGRPT